MANVLDGHFSHGTPPPPQPSSSAFTREAVADGFQRAIFILPGLSNLHLEKAYWVVECREENISLLIIKWE